MRILCLGAKKLKLTLNLFLFLGKNLKLTLNPEITHKILSLSPSLSLSLTHTHTHCTLCRTHTQHRRAGQPATNHHQAELSLMPMLTSHAQPIPTPMLAGLIMLIDKETHL